MKRKIRMDDLINRKLEPFASFHDATLQKITVDYDNKTLSAEFEMCVGNPAGSNETERNRTRRGILSLAGLVLWAMEPPDNSDHDRWGPLWLTHDCLMEEASTDKGKTLASILDPDLYAWCIFFSDTNSFGYCAAREAMFEWQNALNQALAADHKRPRPLKSDVYEVSRP